MKIESIPIRDDNDQHFAKYTMNEDEENVLWDALDMFLKTTEDSKEKQICFEMMQAINDEYGIE
jgi:hypothetical protein